MKHIIYIRRRSILLILLTSVYGVSLILKPELMTSYKIYTVLEGMLSSTTYGVIFAAAGVIKAAGIVFNAPRLRLAGITLMAISWTSFLAGFVLSGQYSTMWVFAAYALINIFMVAAEEVF
jgi:hypothetical protein